MNYVPTKGRPLGATPEAKSSRYAWMGLASVGVVGYYWKHNNPWVAGLYSVIAFGYFATSQDYKKEATAIAALPKVSV